MESNAHQLKSGWAAIEALQMLGFTIEEIRPIIPRLTGYSFSRIADRVGISRTTVTRTMSGGNRSFWVMQEIANTLDIPMEVLFADKLDDVQRRPGQEIINRLIWETENGPCR